MKQWYVMIVGLLVIITGVIWWYKPWGEQVIQDTNDAYVVVGSANPGEIILYKVEAGTLKEQRRVNTGYKFVYTVRIGDSYNNGESVVIAGAGDSFYKDPYGCHVISYDLELKKIDEIDTLSDLRCKDLAIDDLDHDGDNEVILGTHGEGRIMLYQHIAGVWQKEVVEHNYIAQIDKIEGLNHRVPNDSLPCDECVVQSAVHIVKAVDTDGVGEKEIIATISSPLELQDVDEISFVMLYRKNDGVWEKEVIDRAENIEFRSIEFGDIDHNGKQDIIVGTGSPREASASVMAYEYADGTWNKKQIFTDNEAKNMKGLVVTDYDQNGKDSIILGTGFPDAKLYHINWDGSAFVAKELDRVSSLFPPGGQFNAMAALVVPETQHIIISGMSTFPEKKIGWEASEQGFIVYYENSNGTLAPQLVDTPNILGMDLYIE